jgi:hypothetical protein
MRDGIPLTFPPLFKVESQLETRDEVFELLEFVALLFAEEFDSAPFEGFHYLLELEYSLMAKQLLRLGE